MWGPVEAFRTERKLELTPNGPHIPQRMLTSPWDSPDRFQETCHFMVSFNPSFNKNCASRNTFRSSALVVCNINSSRTCIVRLCGLPALAFFLRLPTHLSCEHWTSSASSLLGREPFASLTCL